MCTKPAKIYIEWDLSIKVKGICKLTRISLVKFKGSVVVKTLKNNQIVAI